MNTLHQIDCMEYMKDIPDNHFDLGIVDPPYGIGAGKEKPHNGWKDYGQKQWDNSIPDKIYFDELLRVSKNQIIWGGNYFTDYLYHSMGWILWDKGQRDFSLADGELAWTSFHRALRIFNYARGKALKDTRIHPTQKPIALYKWLLTNYAKPGDKLFDSHSGSGSFRITAYDMGFDLVSCELDADYCRDNEARFQNHIKQIDLFKPEEIQKSIFQGELL